MTDEEIERRLTKLEALEAAGVDNWDGYDWAMEVYHRWLEGQGLADD